MKLLHIDSSILGTSSSSRSVTQNIVDGLRAKHPDLTVSYRDLFAEPLPHLTPQTINTTHPLSAKDDTPNVEKQRSDAALADFLEADVVVIGAPMYNFSIPSQLKAWLDRILIPHKTFTYDANGVRGLAGGKRVILAVTRGGFYGSGSPMAALEHVESYLKGAFKFIGIDAEVIVADGMNTPERGKSVAQASVSARAIQW